MTRKQAEYQARRAQEAAYNRAMHNPMGAGRNRDRQDSADRNGRLAYAAKLREHGFEVA